MMHYEFVRRSTVIRQIARQAMVSGLAVAFSFGSAAAHNGVVHKNADEARRHAQEAPSLATLPDTLGFPNVKGGDFKLLDQSGAVRTSRSPEGQFQLVFFGYANCKGICSVAVPRMAEAAKLLEAQAHLVTPLLVTVDPERDTVHNMKAAVSKFHPRMVGLTGSKEQLAVAYKAFQVENKVAYVDPKEGPVYAHGSFIYLLAPDGAFKTLFPPILSPERMAVIVRKYIKPK